MARRKSARQINDQALRLLRTYSRSGSPTSERMQRLYRIRDTARRYVNNISSFFGNRDGYVSNRQYDVAVSRRRYMGLANG